MRQTTSLREAEGDAASQKEPKLGTKLTGLLPASMLAVAMTINQLFRDNYFEFA